jgi:hypothetical protein
VEAIEVTARFSPKGELFVQRFVWRGVEYPVTATGRGWVDDAGRHVLVMIPGDKVMELVFSSAEARWYYKPNPALARQRS